MPWIKTKTVGGQPVSINPAEIVAIVEWESRSEVFLSSGAVLDVMAKGKDLFGQLPDYSPSPHAV
ncbi:MAG: hypothetical protein WAM82_26630 [Thermoanaerobaculia bacterium]